MKSLAAFALLIVFVCFFAETSAGDCYRFEECEYTCRYRYGSHCYHYKTKFYPGYPPIECYRCALRTTTIGYISGSVILFLIIVILISCFCCPGCLCYPSHTPIYEVDTVITTVPGPPPPPPPGFNVPPPPGFNVPPPPGFNVPPPPGFNVPPPPGFNGPPPPGFNGPPPPPGFNVPPPSGPPPYYDPAGPPPSPHRPFY